MDEGWRKWHGRWVRACDCSDWDDDATLPIRPGEPHVRERVDRAPVEICYHVDEAKQVITVLFIRTMKGEAL